MSVSNSLGYQGFPIPVGSVLPYAGQITPSGWLICDGTTYSTNDYPALFGVIGNKYGSSFSGAVQQTGNTLVCINFDGTVTQLGTTLTIVSATVGQQIVVDMEIAIIGFNNVVILGILGGSTYLVDVSQTVATATVAYSTAPDTAQGGFIIGREIILSDGFLPVTVTDVVSGVATVTPSQTTPVISALSNDFALPDLVGRYIQGSNVANPDVQPATINAGGSFTLDTANIPQFNPILSAYTTTASIAGTKATNYASNGAYSAVGGTRLVQMTPATTNTFTTVLNNTPSSTYAIGRVPPEVSAPLTADSFTLESLELVYIMKATWN